ncbi:hypothetical protein AcW1_009335 [Taiwanofungus camphoratus]|nr:hypothetical protein AcV5_003410 [Antrodia cinnamomea]KAI0935073.1 hypothetical protein AcV7_003980 [Antrodia cinnamomea]KAI0947628.1 hypothetical protein AcW1_009335 [Antrodia cinnamomea]
MNRIPPNQQRIMVVAASVLALAAGAMYYSKPGEMKAKPAEVQPESAALATRSVRAQDQKEDANPTAQSADV